TCALPISPSRCAWRGGYGRTCSSDPGRRESCGRPCAEPSVEEKTGPRRYASAGSVYISWRGTPRSPLNFYASDPCIALCAFFHKAGILSLFAAHPSPQQSTRELLTELYTVATAAVDPAPALAARLERLDRGPRRRWILALGKAAMPMARAAVEMLARWG